MFIKEIPNDDASWPTNLENVQIVWMNFLFLVILLISMQRNVFLFHFPLKKKFLKLFSFLFSSNLSSSGRSHIGQLFTIEEQKKVGTWRTRTLCQTYRPYWRHRQAARHQNDSCFPHFRTSISFIIISFSRLDCRSTQILLDSDTAACQYISIFPFRFYW